MQTLDIQDKQTDRRAVKRVDKTDRQTALEWT